MSETLPDFCVYLPVTAGCAKELRATAVPACERIQAYLDEERVPLQATVRPEFGITLASRAMVAEHLATLAGELFDIQAFIAQFQEIVRPHEPAWFACPVKTVRVRRGQGVCAVRLPLDGQARQARYIHRQRAAIQAAFRIGGGDHVHLLGGDHVSIINVGKGARRPALPIGHMGYIRNVVRQEVARTGLSRVRFGKFMIGTSYHEPLPGTAP